MWEPGTAQTPGLTSCGSEGGSFLGIRAQVASLGGTWSWWGWRASTWVVTLGAGSALGPLGSCFLSCVHSGLCPAGSCWDWVPRVPGLVVGERGWGPGYRVSCWGQYCLCPQGRGATTSGLPWRCLWVEAEFRWGLFLPGAPRDTRPESLGRVPEPRPASRLPGLWDRGGTPRPAPQPARDLGSGFLICTFHVNTCTFVHTKRYSVFK